MPNPWRSEGREHPVRGHGRRLILEGASFSTSSLFPVQGPVARAGRRDIGRTGYGPPRDLGSPTRSARKPDPIGHTPVWPQHGGATTGVRRWRGQPCRSVWRSTRRAGCSLGHDVIDLTRRFAIRLHREPTELPAESVSGADECLIAAVGHVDPLKQAAQTVELRVCRFHVGDQVCRQASSGCAMSRRDRGPGIVFRIGQADHRLSGRSRAAPFLLSSPLHPARLTHATPAATHPASH